MMIYSRLWGVVNILDDLPLIQQLKCRSRWNEHNEMIMIQGGPKVSLHTLDLIAQSLSAQSK